MIWLRSYGNERTGSAMSVLAAPSDHVKGKHVLLIDGVLDKGNTVVRATKLLMDAGAASVKTVVAIDKLHSDAVAKADYALYTGVQDFIVGYGMDDAGKYRALPYIGKVEG
jgi:hypoxanthine phosphoribosyltransferase